MDFTRKLVFAKKFTIIPRIGIEMIAEVRSISLKPLQLLIDFYLDELQLHVDENSSSMDDSPSLHVSSGEHADDAHSPNNSPHRRSISNRRRSSLNPVNLTVEKNHRRNSVDDKHSPHDDERVC